MGEVYRAIDTRLDRVVAIKVLTRTDEKVLARFKNEARIQSSLRHKHITTFYEFLEYKGRPCIVMECVEGMTLEERLRTKGPFPLAEALILFQDVVEAVEYMHLHGVIHRDIKASNIKITPAGRVKLLDFGIAKGHTTPGFTATGAVIGTPTYLSPEQITGQGADARSDIWALGVLLYEMLTGHVPFEASNILELYGKISKAVYMPPSVLNPSITRRVEAVMARCLQKKPEDRYSSVEALRKAIGSAAHSATAAFRLPLMQAQRAGQRAWYLLRERLAGGTSGRVGRQSIVVGSLGLSVLLIGVLYLLLRPGPVINPDPPPPGGDIVQVLITVVAGRAEVVTPDGKVLGTTPYVLKGSPKSQQHLILWQEGYHDKILKFELNERRHEYPIAMDRLRR